MEDELLIAQQLNYDGLINSGVKKWEFPITQNLRKNCKQSFKQMQLEKEKTPDRRLIRNHKEDQAWRNQQSK